MKVMTQEELNQRTKEIVDFLSEKTRKRRRRVLISTAISILLSPLH
ncbi:hypothetical protein MKY48_08525 [Paenibacillus sp. FSL W8-0187]